MELIAATTSALDNIGFTDFTLRINDRRLLTDMIKSAGFGDDDVMPVCIIFDKLDKIGLDGVKDELLGKGYAAEKVEKFIAVISAADDEESALAAAEGFASDASVVEKMRQVLRFAREIAYGRFNVVYDKSLVRGMGYYTGMVFEIVSPKFGSSVAGGGRYDNMIGKFTGESVPAVGFPSGLNAFAQFCRKRALCRRGAKGSFWSITRPTILPRLRIRRGNFRRWGCMLRCSSVPKSSASRWTR